MCHQACLQDNSSPVQTRIPKFGSEVLKALVNIPIFCDPIDLHLQGHIEL